MREIPLHMLRALVPNGSRRAVWHDYSSSWFYMITLNAAPGAAPFSTLTGIPGDRYYPPRPELTELGSVVADCLSELRQKFPVQIKRRCIMPEHLHFVLYVTERIPYHLGHIISVFKGEVTRRASGLWQPRSEGFETALPSVL